MDMKVYLCIVNNSVIFRKLLLTTLDLCLKATSSESDHIFPLIILILFSSWVWA